MPLLNPFADTLQTYLELERRGRVSDVLRKQLTILAKAYAGKNGIFFDGTYHGALKLLEEASHTVNAHFKKVERQHRRNQDQPGSARYRVTRRH